ncbi:hypothetical protein PUN28_013011 [Cardiocondyla obscurior]|uniref:Uncharacterized protein n=1 Tax=Cardiocondyla obscurior TaxID=286306 RepID=A0AAW2F7S7_9HYME
MVRSRRTETKNSGQGWTTKGGLICGHRIGCSNSLTIVSGNVKTRFVARFRINRTIGYVLKTITNSSFFFFLVSENEAINEVEQNFFCLHIKKNFIFKRKCFTNKLLVCYNYYYSMQQTRFRRNI